MDERFVALAAAAADRHGVFTTLMAQRFGVSNRLRNEWLALGWIERLGTRTFRFAGSPRSWRMTLASALGDLGSGAAISGRSVAALHRLDGFVDGAVEIWVPRSCRNRDHPWVARSSSRPLKAGDVVTIDGLRCVTAERLILDSVLFRFSEQEIHNAIDSAIRMRLVSEKRLRARIVGDLSSNAWHRRTLVDALVDTGGESALERRFLAIVRGARLPRPQLQRVYRDGTRTLARVDAEFDCGLVVEVAGHGTHATRLQRQLDEQRRTELTLRNKQVITFTYDDVYGRPKWVVGVLRTAGVGNSA
ncbi:MAG: hypothetical protein ABI862_02290 [Ilumatobacteraceae bacterium]